MFRSGYYGLFEGKECKLRGTSSGWVVVLQNQSTGFANLELKGKEIKKIQSASRVRTKAKYKGFTFSLHENSKLEKGKVRLWLDSLDFEAYDHFGFNYREDANIEVDVDELDEIWEEREKLSKFPFKVEKIKYLKGGKNIT
ncbi:hypothetical protein [Flagellimonas sp. 2504JD4-2]